jgi:hypothetical protein
MLNFPFYNPVNNNLKKYLKQNNENTMNKLKLKYNEPSNYNFKIDNNSITHHDSDYEFNFCDLSDYGDYSENNTNNYHDKNDNNKISNRYTHDKFIKLMFFTLLGSTSFVSLSVLYYNFYIKK